MEAEADKLTQAAQYECSEVHQDYRSGHYDRNLTTASGDVTLHMPHFKGISFETAIIELNKKAYVNIEAWHNRLLQGGKYPYVYVDGIYLKRNWCGEYENVAILVAIAVTKDGFREVLSTTEGMKEDKTSWVIFFQWPRGRGLPGTFSFFFAWHNNAPLCSYYPTLGGFLSIVRFTESVHARKGGRNRAKKKLARFWMNWNKSKTFYYILWKNFE